MSAVLSSDCPLLLIAPDFRVGSWCSKPGTFPFYAHQTQVRCECWRFVHESGVIRPFNWVASATGGTLERLYRDPKVAWPRPIVNSGRDLLTVALSGRTVFS